MDKIETVTVNLTLQVPKKYYEFLQKLGLFAGVTPEELWTQENYSLLGYFISGGFAEAWTDGAIKEFDEDLEELARKVEDEVYAATS